MIDTFIKPLIVVCGFQIIIWPIFIVFCWISFFSYLLSFCWRSPSKKNQNQPTSIIITGAASGIGKQLAIDFAKKYPFVKLGLIVRKLDERAENVKKECEEHSATVILKAIDVADRENMKTFINEMDKKYPVDMVIANAGVSHFTLGYDSNNTLSTESMDYDIFSINLMGVINLLTPSITLMKKRKNGTIVIISSQVSYEPTSSSYGCAKQAITNYGKYLRMSLSKVGISVINVLPGWVSTQMADKAEGVSKIGIIPVEVASSNILRGIESNTAEIVFPTHFGLFLRTLQMIPMEWKELFLKLGMEKISNSK